MKRRAITIGVAVSIFLSSCASMNSSPKVSKRVDTKEVHVKNWPDNWKDFFWRELTMLADAVIIGSAVVIVRNNTD